MIESVFKPIVKAIVPQPVRQWFRKQEIRMTEAPLYGCVRFGSFRRTTPIHRGFGVGRGTYIDRYYIESFLERNSADIAGRVLELSDNEYTLRYGGKRVTQSDVLDVRADHVPATIVGDLTSGDGIPSNAFDCVILTQALMFIYDVRSAIRCVHRILKPGGRVLVSVSGISQIVPDEMKYCGDFWRFTSLSLRRLFEDVFPRECVQVESRGNVLAAVAFLHGLAVEELRRDELDYHDADYELSVLLRAVKPAD